MQKKSHLLTDLKKQVLILKSQLENIERHRTNHHHRQSTSMNRSTLSQGSRFNTLTCDSTYLDRGVKKFPLQERFKNLSQVISQKSKIEKQPNLCQYRLAQEKKTRQNFSTEVRESKVGRSKSPNPLTGEGYSDRKKGIKTRFESAKTQQIQQQRSLSGRKHFPVHNYR